jgi:ribose transport system substrate-binding protein
MAGCGGVGTGGVAGSAGPSPGGSSKRVHLVGFDASEPVVSALSQGTIEGVVVQNPFKIGELGVKTLVQHLEKKPVEPGISTGETMVTPENMNALEAAGLLAGRR